jgi:hypothetical protein
VEPIIRMLTLTGRKGGLRRTEAKALHARQNIRLRWHPRDREGIIPIPALIDGAWYRGAGPNGSVALWDGARERFHTVGVLSSPETRAQPKIRRITGLKSERHVSSPGGTFAPEEILALCDR